MKAFMIACFALLAAPALAQQSAPEIVFDSVPDFPKLPPGMNFGEVPGVAVNSKGHMFVFTRSNSATGSAYAPAAAQLLEFDANGEFVREVGKGLYAWSFAHSVRTDKDDNIWAIDKGSDMIVKFNPAVASCGCSAAARNPRTRKARPGSTSIRRFRRSTACSAKPTDVAWIPRATSISRTATSIRGVAKISKDGDWVEVMGEPGTGPGQFRTVHAIAIDRNDNVYVGDRGNHRVQVFDTEGKFPAHVLGRRAAPLPAPRRPTATPRPGIASPR